MTTYRTFVRGKEKYSIGDAYRLKDLKFEVLHGNFV